MELEYRVWDISRKKMIHPEDEDYTGVDAENADHPNQVGGYFLMNQKGIIFCNDGIVLDNWHDKYIINLYVGKKDKKGKKIYDGDIIQFIDHTSDKIISGGRETCVVNWFKHSSSFSPQDIEDNHKGGKYIHYWDQIEDIEIIGHKFQPKYKFLIDGKES